MSASAAALTTCCGTCGVVISTPAPTAADIGAAAEAQAEAGWGHDDHGRARCPDCLGGAPVSRPADPAPEQGRLF